MLKNYKYIYIPMSVLLLVVSSIMFLFFNAFLLYILIYYRVNYRELFRINIFLMVIWFLLFSCYSYLLTHEPSIPLSPGDSFMVNKENLVLIIGYRTRFPSLCRSIFVETIVIIYLMSVVSEWYPTIYLF